MYFEHHILASVTFTYFFVCFKRRITSVIPPCCIYMFVCPAFFFRTGTAVSLETLFIDRASQFECTSREKKKQDRLTVRYLHIRCSNKDNKLVSIVFKPYQITALEKGKLLFLSV